MARTPDAPAVKEIKPTAAITWKRIAFGEIIRGGRPGLERPGEWRELGEPLRGVFVDAGENGLFSPPEFETLTALGLMEFITPEEVARDVVWEVLGHSTGHDVVAALDGATSGPTYRAGVLRHFAVQRMDELEREHGVESVAYEMLGPPRLSKLLFESVILGRLTEWELQRAASLDAGGASQAALCLVQEDADLR